MLNRVAFELYEYDIVVAVSLAAVSLCKVENIQTQCRCTAPLSNVINRGVSNYCLIDYHFPPANWAFQRMLSVLPCAVATHAR